MGDIGNILGGLGKALGGLAIPGSFAQRGALAMSPLAHMMGAGGELNPGEKMFGMLSPFSEMIGIPKPGENRTGNIDPRMIIDESGAMGKPPPQMGNGDGAEQIVSGDGWNPRKPTILGALADAFLMSRGGKPMFSLMRDRRNLNEAMGGYVEDPVGAMKRLSQIPGQEENVTKLMNQYRDDERADIAAEGLNDSRRAKFYKNMGGLLNTVKNSKDPNAAYQSALPILRRLSQKAGDETEWGDTYDEGAVDNFIGMNIEPDDQIRQAQLNEYRAAKLGLDERKFEGQTDYRERRLEQIDAAEDGRNTRAASKPGGQSAVGGFVRDSSGNIVGQVSTNGRTAIVAAPDGGFQGFEVLPNGKLGKRIPQAIVDKFLQGKGK